MKKNKKKSKSKQHKFGILHIPKNTFVRAKSVVRGKEVDDQKPESRKIWENTELE